MLHDGISWYVLHILSSRIFDIWIWMYLGNSSPSPWQQSPYETKTVFPTFCNPCMKFNSKFGFCVFILTLSNALLYKYKSALWKNDYKRKHIFCELSRASCPMPSQPSGQMSIPSQILGQPSGQIAIQSQILSQPSGHTAIQN